MARPACSILGLASILASGGIPLARSLEDFSVLLQGPTSSPPQGKSRLTEAQVKAMWPDLDRIFDQVKDSVGDVTDQVGEVMDDVDQKIDTVGDQINHIAGNFAEKVADALNRVLDLAKQEADKLLEMTMAEKTEFILSMNATLAKGNDAILPDFEKAASKVMTSAWGRWQQFRTLVDRSSTSLAKGLRAAGQVQLADKLGQMGASAVGSLDDFLGKLRNADEDLHGLGRKGGDEAQEALATVNDGLNQALEHVAAFVAKYQQIFQEAAERISNALVASTEKVVEAFASVQQNVTAITWRVRSSGRELALGVHRAIAGVAKAKNMTAPEWHPVSAPSVSDIEWSAAAGARLPLLAALAAFAAVLGAAAGI